MTYVDLRVEAVYAALLNYSFGPTADAEEVEEIKHLTKTVLAAADSVSEQAAMHDLAVVDERTRITTIIKVSEAATNLAIQQKLIAMGWRPPPMLNGLTEAQTTQTASVAELAAPSEQALPPLPEAVADQMHAYALAARQQPAAQVPVPAHAGKNWHTHHVAVGKGALQMIRNALRNDAEAGKTVRAEMLEELDKATFDIQAPAAGEPASAQQPAARVPLTPVPGAVWGMYGEEGVALVQRGTEDERIAKAGGERLYRIKPATSGEAQ